MLVYNTSDWHKFGFKKAGIENQEINKLSVEAEKDYEDFKSLLGDVYSRLYTGDSVEKKEDLTNLEFYEKAHETLNDLPEWKQMISRTKNNLRYSSMATSVIGEALYDKLPKNEDQLQNIQKIQDEVELLEKLADFTKNSDLKDNIKNKKQETIDKLKMQKELHAKMTKNINSSHVRVGLIKALKGLNKEITEMNQCAGLFGTQDAPLNPDSAGFDMLAKKFKENNEFKQIIKFAGRFKSMISNAKETRSEYGRSEVTGITTGDDLSRMTDSEIIKLRSNKKQFLLDYSERRLMQTELRGKETQGKGPMVLLLDMSGSMNGVRHLWAKGFSLAFMQEAISQNRAFYLILFNNSLIKRQVFFPKDHDNNISNFIDIISVKPAGGTNFNRPLDSAFDIIMHQEENKSFSDADIIMISDGEGSIDSTIYEQYLKSKKLFKFFFIMIEGDINEKIKDIATDYFSVSMNENKTSEFIKKIV